MTEGGGGERRRRREVGEVNGDGGPRWGRRMVEEVDGGESQVGYLPMRNNEVFEDGSEFKRTMEGFVDEFCQRWRWMEVGFANDGFLVDGFGRRWEFQMEMGFCERWRWRSDTVDLCHGEPSEDLLRRRGSDSMDLLRRRAMVKEVEESRWWANEGGDGDGRWRWVVVQT
ncbi:hypothetical protein L6452_34296 [Arctium lappa]|uniref:Uncharacterized protein n=1 Tax=Arctium lappa TaxID=4217 RepID=A0ACB8YI24_ARCLA|nr:hypothetical protein L6452_34296 [Arctium lappa]